MVFTPPPPPPTNAGFPPPGIVRRPGVPGVVAVLGLAIVIAVDYAVAVGPWLVSDRPYLSETASLGLSLVPFVLYAALVAVVGRSPGRRLGAAGLAGAAILLHIAFWFGIREIASELDDLDDLQRLHWVSAAVIGVLLVAAWGVARRTGPVWWAGLLVVPVVIVGQALVWDEFSQRVWELANDIDSPGGRWSIILQLAAWAAWSLVPPLAAGFACWLLDQVAPGRRNDAS